MSHIPGEGLRRGSLEGEIIYTESLRREEITVFKKAQANGWRQEKEGDTNELLLHICSAAQAWMRKKEEIGWTHSGALTCFQCFLNTL